MSRNTSNVFTASINISGSCIARDIFSMHESDGGYKIFRYVNLFSPLSLCEDAVELDTEKYINTDLSEYVTKFRKRCVMHDLTRASVDFIQQRRTDWLVIDTALFRKNLYQIGKKRLTCFGEDREFLDNLSKMKFIPPIVGEITLEDMTDKELKRRMTFYVNKLLSAYTAEKIILVEAKNAAMSIDKNENISIFCETKTNTLENKRMNRCFKLIKSLLPDCHVIPMPQNVIADADHKLGLAPLHYTIEYYDYALAAVHCIQEKLPREQEEARISQLCRECGNLYADRYFPILSDSYVSVKAKYMYDRLRRLCTRYIKFFKRKR